VKKAVMPQAPELRGMGAIIGGYISRKYPYWIMSDTG
jgi:hypothetical protein